MLKQTQYPLIARSYADALFQAAEKQGLRAQVVAEVAQIARSLAAVPLLHTYLGSPQIPTADKIKLVEGSMKDRYSPLVMTVLRLMIQRDRTRYLGHMLEYFQLLVERASGVEPASVATAHPLSPQDRQRLQATLEKFTGNKLNIDFSVDPELLGGIAVRYKDTLLDGTVRHGLNELRTRLEGAQVN